MTMLDRMRRHRDWLKWSLGLVCVAFVLFYIPDFLRGSGADAASSDTVAKVQGREITSGEFRRTYQTQLQAYRSAYGNNMSEQLLKQLGVDQQILQQMVDERAAPGGCGRGGAPGPGPRGGRGVWAPCGARRKGAGDSSRSRFSRKRGVSW